MKDPESFTLETFPQGKGPIKSAIQYILAHNHSIMAQLYTVTGVFAYLLVFPVIWRAMAFIVGFVLLMIILIFNK